MHGAVSLVASARFGGARCEGRSPTWARVCGLACAVVPVVVGRVPALALVAALMSTPHAAAQGSSAARHSTDIAVAASGSSADVHAPVTREAAPVRVLSLHEAVERAMGESPRILDARDDVVRAETNVTVASSAFRPSVIPSASGALGTTTLANQSYGVAASQRTPFGTEFRANVTSQSTRNQFGTYFFSDVTFLVSQPLLRGAGKGAAQFAIDSARASVLDASQSLTRTRVTVALDVAAAYFTVIDQASRLQAVRRAVERAQGLRDQSAAQLTAGRVSRLDVLRADQLLARARAEQNDAEAGLASAKDQLRFLMGASYDLDFDVEMAAGVQAVPALSDAVSLAVSSRPEFIAAAQRVRDAERAVGLARNEHLPRVDFQLALTRQAVGTAPFGGLNRDPFRVATFATASMPFADAASDARVRTTALDQARRTRELRTLREAIELEVRQAHRDAQRAEQEVSLAASSVDLAKLETEVANVRFSRGLSNNLDVIAAEETLLANENRQTTARSQLALARFRLLAAAGVLDPLRDIR